LFSFFEEQLELTFKITSHPRKFLSAKVCTFKLSSL